MKRYKKEWESNRNLEKVRKGKTSISKRDERLKTKHEREKWKYTALSVVGTCCFYNTYWKTFQRHFDWQIKDKASLERKKETGV